MFMKLHKWNSSKSKWKKDLPQATKVGQVVKEMANKTFEICLLLN